MTLEEMKRALENIVSDFDQTGCSSNLGVVSTDLINDARELLGMDLLGPKEDRNFNEG